MDWPFDQPKNCAVFTVDTVLAGDEPILHVTHDADDHGWQFLGSSGATMEHAKVVALETIVKLDPSVLLVADMPPGWYAERTSPDEPWTRAQRT